MKITIVYDNEVKKEGLRAGWGFSALIEDEKLPPILFDTGADSPTLLYNMEKLNIDPQDIDVVVISHAHGDHTGGLSGILRMNEIAELYLPSSFRRAFPGRKVTMVKDPIQIHDNVFSSGELEGVEQSLALKTDRGIFVLTGCAHPAMKSILGAAAKFGKLYGIAHHLSPCLVLMSSRGIVCPDRTCFFARAIASRSSLRERISIVSRIPSNSSMLKIIALLTPFFVMANRSYFSSTSLMIADRLFLASARGMVLVMSRLLYHIKFDHNYSLMTNKMQIFFWI